MQEEQGVWRAERWPVCPQATESSQDLRSAGSCTVRFRDGPPLVPGPLRSNLSAFSHTSCSCGLPTPSRVGVGHAVRVSATRWRGGGALRNPAALIRRRTLLVSTPRSAAIGEHTARRVGPTLRRHCRAAAHPRGGLPARSSLLITPSSATDRSWPQDWGGDREAPLRSLREHRHGQNLARGRPGESSRALSFPWCVTVPPGGGKVLPFVPLGRPGHGPRCLRCHRHGDASQVQCDVSIAFDVVKIPCTPPSPPSLGHTPHAPPPCHHAPRMSTDPDGD